MKAEYGRTQIAKRSVHLRSYLLASAEKDFGLPPLSPQEFREAVRAQTDIVALIGEAIALQPRHGGREYVGLCCFHDDHNPSLHVYPDRQSFRCWVCDTGGDCFTFLMERDKVGFREALEILARRANIPIPQHISKTSPEQESNKARLLEVLQWAENLFHRTLLTDPSAARAREYLQSRGFDEETIREYRIGYHPNNWEWLPQIANGKYSNQLFVQARLMGERDEGRGHFDYFVDRVLFPIHNERGQPVGFGGRILPGSTDDRKYWNSPESPVFHKSRLVYALDKAREAIRETGTVVVTEGYTDCIACHRAGVKNVVATLGTALTDMHVTTIKRFARKVVLIFDGDEAGQKAANRAVEHFLAQDVDLRILTLPDNLDPAEFLEARGEDAFRELIERAPEAWEFKFRSVQKEHGLATIDGRQRVLEQMIALLAQVPKLAENVREGLLVANLAQRLAVPEQQVRDRLRQVRSKGTRKLRIDAAETRIRADIERILSGKLTRNDRLECDLLEMLLAGPQWAAFAARSLSAEEFTHPALRMIAQECFTLAGLSQEVTAARLMDRVEEADLSRLLVWLDERARAKHLAEKLSSACDPIDGTPLLLRRSIDNLNWRREEQAHQAISVKLSQPSGDGPPQLDAAMEEMLRQAAEFHQRRATSRQRAGC